MKNQKTSVRKLCLLLSHQIWNSVSSLVKSKMQISSLYLASNKLQHPVSQWYVVWKLETIPKYDLKQNTRVNWQTTQVRVLTYMVVPKIWEYNLTLQSDLFIYWSSVQSHKENFYSHLCLTFTFDTLQICLQCRVYVFFENLHCELFV